MHSVYESGEEYPARFQPHHTDLRAPEFVVRP
jgi:hypothetical protein